MRAVDRILKGDLEGISSRHVLTACSTFLLITLSGCLPIGWVTPPARLEIAGGASTLEHRSIEREGDVRTASRQTAALDMRVAASPLQAIESQEHRFIDLDVGYGWRYLGRYKFFQHGPFAAAGLLLPVDTMHARLHVGGRIQALVGSSQGGYDVRGHDLALRLGLDWSRWGKGPFSGCDSGMDGLICVAGYSLGEAGVMPYVDLSRSQLQGTPQWTVMFGVSLRVPMSAAGGILVINPLSLL